MTQRRKSDDNETSLTRIESTALTQKAITDASKEAIHLEIDNFLNELELETIEAVEAEIDEKIELAKQHLRIKKLEKVNRQTETKITETESRVSAKKKALSRLENLL